MPEQETPEVTPVYMPRGAKKLGSEVRPKIALNIIGPSGYGKSFCAVHQFAKDPRYGKQDVMIAMVEDATSTYGKEAAEKDFIVIPIASLSDMHALVRELGAASKAGKKMPKLFVIDDLSSLSEKERRRWAENPKLTDDGVEDTRAMFREKGYALIDLMMDVRSGLPGMDSITLIRAHENKYFIDKKDAPTKGGVIELALEGNIAPKNLTGHSSMTLYLQAEAPTFAPEAFFAAFEKKLLFQPHRTVALTPEEVEREYAEWKKDSTRKVDTTIINRYFLTQNNGEVIAKGNVTLRLKEKAYAPDILAKVHGEKTLFL